DELHDEVWVAIGEHADVVHLHDTRVVDVRRDARFGHESLSNRQLRYVGAQRLDHDAASESGVVGKKSLSVAAAPETRAEYVSLGPGQREPVRRQLLGEGHDARVYQLGPRLATLRREFSAGFVVRNAMQSPTICVAFPFLRAGGRFRLRPISKGTLVAIV